jgi:ketosteroid isomerase-like protein
MADSQNVATVRRFVDAFNRLDVDYLTGRFAPDVELREWPTAPGARTYHGLDGVRSALDSWFEVWEWMQVEIEELVDAGDRILVMLLQRAKGRASEIEVEVKTFNVYTFGVDGRVTRLELFTDRDPAVEAAGLTPVHEEEKR